MTHANLNETAEQFVKLVTQHRLGKATEQDGDDVAGLMKQVMDRQWPGVPPATVNAALLFNSVDQAFKKQDRSIAADHTRWVDTGQIDMFGLPGWRLPEKMTGKDGVNRRWTETAIKDSLNNLMEILARTLENIEELQAKLDHERDKARMVEEQIARVEACINAMEQNGLDPETVTYAEILAQETQKIVRSEDGARPSAKR